MKKYLLQLKNNLKFKNTNAWILLSVTLLYAYILVLFEFRDWMIFLYALLSIPLIIGLRHVYQSTDRISEKFSLKDYDIIFAFFGVIVTYLLAHQLNISAVIASSFIGVLGYYLFPKNSVAIYCGSFAGMVSSYLFNYYEVGFISIVCGVLFVFLKPVYNGYGGKLGSTAFIATMFVAIVLEKDFLLVVNDLNLLRLFIVSILGVFIPFFMTHYFKLSPVFTSAIASLVYALIVIYLVQDYLTCSLVFFSASFIGMSAKDKLPNLFYLLLAALVHAFLFHVYFEHYNGLGGKLGLMALTTMMIVTGFKVMVEKIKLISKKAS